MRILQDDFSPDQPITAVGSSWFNSVAEFINKLTGSRGIVVDRSGEFPKVSLIAPDEASASADKVLTIKKNSMSPSWEESGGKMGDSPVENNTNLPTNMATPASQYAPVFTNWDAGGENGVKMRLYTCTGVSGRHYWYPVDIEITNSGTIKSIKMVETEGVRQAFQAG